MRRAVVQLDGQPVGQIWEEGSEVVFQYSDDWLRRQDNAPVSLTLPVRPDACRQLPITV